MRVVCSQQIRNRVYAHRASEMSKAIGFEERVVVVTGAGGGLGRSYALEFARRGARVVVNDLGGSIHGEGKSRGAADDVVTEIHSLGGEAVTNYDSVEDGDRIIRTAIDNFGRIDVVVNNAGILRDATFLKMTDVDWDLVYRVHALGAYKVTKAAWPHMLKQEYGRIVNTASAAGIYGNFGQANYAFAKLGIHGLTQTLSLEGARKGIKVSTIAPVAGSRLLESILAKDVVDALKPECVTPLVMKLCSERMEETGGLYEIGAGWMAKLRWERSKGVFFDPISEISAEMIDDAWAEVCDFTDADNPTGIQDTFEAVFGNLGIEMPQ